MFLLLTLNIENLAGINVTCRNVTPPFVTLHYQNGIFLGHNQLIVWFTSVLPKNGGGGGGCKQKSLDFLKKNIHIASLLPYLLC